MRFPWAGYEDQNDHVNLLIDPIFKLTAGRSPSEANLAGQPTLSRFEHHDVGGREVISAGAPHYRRGTNAVDLVGLVGVELRTGQQHGFLWNGDYVERLWQTLLIGPGACFATPGGQL